MCQLVWIDHNGTQVAALGSPAETQLFPELSPDGRLVAVQRERDIWLLDTERDVLSDS